jgi:signal transduction histidine kinase/ActR/RegA family two-component response regulator
MPTPASPPAAPDSGDALRVGPYPTGNEHLAQRYFLVMTALGVVVLGLMALTPGLTANRVGSLALAGTLCFCSLLGWYGVRQGQLARTMDLYAVAIGLPVAALIIGSPSLVNGFVTLMTYLPMYALIRGLRRSARLLVPLALLAATMVLARTMGWAVPVWFPGAPMAQMLVALTALIASLLPIGLLQGDLKLTTGKLERELVHRRQVQGELALNHQRLADYAMCASDWFWETDADHRFVQHTMASKDRDNWHPEAFIGRRRWEMAPATDEATQAFWARHQAVLNAHRPFRNMEYEVEVPGLGLRWISVSGVPVFDQGGRFTGYRGSSSDITERKRHEQEMQRALQAAEAGNRAKAEFLSTISHEVRTPLNGILGMAHLMQTTPLNNEQREYLQLLHQSGDMLLAIIDDVLDISRLEKGEVKLDPAPFDPRATLRAVADVLRPETERAQLTLRVDIASEVPALAIGDERRFRQVLLHLGHNAVKFTPKGGVGLALRVHSRPDGAVVLQGTVTDSGIGIAPEHMAKLFEPFSQVDGSITRHHGGTGVGLAISRRLARLMGGDVWAESEPGRGSRFHFTAQLALPPAQVHATPPRDKDPAPLHRKHKLLVVDDVEVNLIVLCKLLQIEGYDVKQATNGEQAVAIWQDWQPDLILMDLQMPLLDGLEATRRIRAQEAQRAPAGQRRVAIIALTGGGAGHSRETCLSAGMDGYLTKPVERPDLVRAVQAHLKAN